MPASGTLEQLFDQIENGEMKVMHLVQFLSREDAEVDPLGATIDKAGNIKVRKGYGETTEPKSPEEYRQRMKVVMHSYLLAKLKYPHKQSLQDAEPHHFQKFVDYILGDQVYGLKAKDEQGNTVSTPAFSLILHYEHQVRKEMVRLLNEDNSLHTALEEARKDGVVKERFFLTPAAMSALANAQKNEDHSYRSRSPRGGHRGWHDKGQDRGGYGKGKKGKGKKGKKGDAVIHSKTPDGREICYKWNSQHDRCRHQCGRLHVCQICFGNHPMHSCKSPPAKDTAGGGQEATGVENRQGWRAPLLQLRHQSTTGGKPLVFRVLYLFSGKHRSTSLKSCLEELAPSFNISVQVEEFDIEQNVSHDLAGEGLQNQLLQKLRSGLVDALVTTPPCSTFSRVRAANMKGPPPVRSRDHLWGFPWLFGQLKQDVMVGNSLVVFSVEMLEAAQEVQLSTNGVPIRTFMEHPEDLGGACREEDGAWFVPASIWQWDRLQRLVEAIEFANFTVVFHQCCWGAPWRKPTRILSNLPQLRHWGFQGWANF